MPFYFRKIAFLGSFLPIQEHVSFLHLVYMTQISNGFLKAVVASRQ